MADQTRSFSIGARQAPRARTQGGGLGKGTPANLDVHDAGDSDNPQEDWGEPAGGAAYGANHTRRPVRTEAARGQGRKTRALNKDIINRRT